MLSSDSPDFVTDFASACNLRFPTEAMVAAMQQALPDLMRRRGSSQAVLNEKLAAHLRCDPSRVQTLHGASQIFPVLKRMITTRPVIRPEPAFGEYTRIFPKAQVYADRPGVDLERLDATIRPDSVVVFATPNSPTGTVVPTAWVHEASHRHPHTLFIVDESFVDFSDETPMIERLEADPVGNVFVIKSLGAALGVPGLRLGGVYSGNPEVIRVLGTEIPIGNLSAPAEFYLDQLPTCRPEFERSLQQTKADRAQFAAMLAALPCVERCHPSGANFLLVALKGTGNGLGERIREQLLARFRVDVNDVSARLDPPGPKLRIAVRLPDDNARFCEALTAVTRRAEPLPV